jgi:hypothetical protein
MKNWYYHVPDMLLVGACYLIVARLVLLPFRHGASAIVRTVNALTTPMVAATAAITPRILPLPLVLLAALAWLYAVRIVLRAATAATGLRLG